MGTQADAKVAQTVTDICACPYIVLVMAIPRYVPSAGTVRFL